MTNVQHTSSPSSGSPPDDSPGAADLAKEQTRQLADTGKEQAANVVGEARAQTSLLLHDARGQVRERADGQVSQLAGFLDQLSGELGEMANGTSSSSGYLTALARDGSSTAKDLSRRLQDGGLDGALDDVRRFARRRPVAFLAAAFGVGLALGRVTRNADLGEVVAHDQSSSTSSGRSGTRPGGLGERVSSGGPAAASTSTTSFAQHDVPGEPDLVPPRVPSSGGAVSPESP